MKKNILKPYSRYLIIEALEARQAANDLEGKEFYKMERYAALKVCKDRERMEKEVMCATISEV